MKVVVTRDHIYNGIALSSACCPIALACKDAGLEKVWVNPLTIRYSLNDKTYIATLPTVAIQFMYHFDTGGSNLSLSVFSFDLPIEQPQDRL